MQPRLYTSLPIRVVQGAATACRPHPCFPLTSIQCAFCSSWPWPWRPPWSPARLRSSRNPTRPSAPTSCATPGCGKPTRSTRGQYGACCAATGPVPERLELFVRAFKIGRRVEVWGRNQGAGRLCCCARFAGRHLGYPGPQAPGRRRADSGGLLPRSTASTPTASTYSPWASTTPTPPTAAHRPRPRPRRRYFRARLQRNHRLPAHHRRGHPGAVRAGRGGPRRRPAHIPVHIFPFELTADKLARRLQSPHLAFWQELAPGYQYFETHHELPNVTVAEAGAYVVR